MPVAKNDVKTRRTCLAIARRMEQSLNQTQAGKVLRLFNKLSVIAEKLDNVSADVLGEPVRDASFQIENCLGWKFNLKDFVPLLIIADYYKNAETAKTVAEAEEYERDFNKGLGGARGYAARTDL
jgi:hypothetical protein